MLRVHLFGRPRLLLDEIAFPLSGRPKVLPLLAYLLVHRASAVSRRSIANALWPDDCESEARVKLRRHLNYARHALPEPIEGLPWVSSAAGHVQWNPACAFWLDVAEFERLVAFPQRLTEAVALYSGDLLSELDEEWLAADRERLRTLYGTALATLLRNLRAARDYARAIDAAQRLLAHDPYREDALRGLMQSRYESGDRAGALADYERFAKTLRLELGVEPMEESRAVYDSLVRDAAPAWTTYPMLDVRPPPVGTSYALPFVGRAAEMATLEKRWAAALAASGALVLIGGDAGIGKSRLVHEFAAYCEQRGAQVYEGAATSRETVLYQPIIDVLRATAPLVGTIRLDPVWVEALATLVPSIVEYVSERRSLAPIEASRERLRLFEACATFWLEIAKRRPLVLIFEDMQWAGPATLALLEYFARRSVRASVLVLATYREDELAFGHPLHGLRRRLERDAAAAVLPLGRLSAAAVEDFISTAAESAHAVSLARMVYEGSEGNPFFMHEILRDLDERGHVRIRDRKWSFDEAWSGALPAAVRDTLAARIARLTEAPKNLVETAAVIGRAFPVELLREATGWPEATVLDALDELTDRRIVSERGGALFAFSHHLIQTVAYDALDPAARVRRHRRIAHVMTGLYADAGDEPAAEIAFHYERGGAPELAAEQYVAAAERALHVYGHEEAERWLSRALELGCDVRLRVRALLLRERIAAVLGDRTGQRRDIDALGGLARGSDDDETRTTVLERRIALANSTGDRRRERTLLRLLQRRVRRTADVPRRARALELQAKYHRCMNEFDAARAVFAELTGLALHGGDRVGYAAARLAIADTYIYEGRLAEAYALLADLRVAVRAEDHRAAWVFTLMTYARAALAEQNYPAMSQFATEAYDISRTIGDREGEALALHTLANGLVYTFRVRETQAHYDRAHELYERMNHRVGLASIAVDLGLFHTEIGLLERALEFYDRATVIATEIDFRFVRAVERINRSYCLRLGTNFAAAKTSADTALTLTRELRSQHLEAAALGTLGAAESALGLHAVALEHLRVAVELRRPAGATPRLGDNLWALAQAYLCAGDTQAALRASQELLALHDAHPHLAPQPTQWLWTAAQAAGACGDACAAERRMREAEACMQSRAAAIDDAATREAFLALPFNRAVAQGRLVFP